MLIMIFKLIWLYRKQLRVGVAKMYCYVYTTLLIMKQGDLWYFPFSLIVL